MTSPGSAPVAEVTCRSCQRKFLWRRRRWKRKFSRSGHSRNENNQRQQPRCGIERSGAERRLVVDARRSVGDPRGGFLLALRWGRSRNCWRRRAPGIWPPLRSSCPARDSQGVRASRAAAEDRPVMSGAADTALLIRSPVYSGEKNNLHMG